MGSVLSSEILDRTERAVKGMFHHHVNKTVLGGYLAVRGLYKVAQGHYGYPVGMSSVETVLMNKTVGNVTKNIKITMKSDFGTNLLPYLRRGSVGAAIGSGLLGYSFYKSFPSPEKNLIIK